jgi:hypothetical protein
VDLAGLQRVPGMLADLLDPARTDTEAAALAA